MPTPWPKLLVALAFGGAVCGYVGSPAGAATVGTEPGAYFPIPASLVFRAAAGEQNHVSVVALSSSQYRIEDPGATVTPATGCSATVDPHVVICEWVPDFTNAGDEPHTGYWPAMLAHLEDGNDTIRFTTAFAPFPGLGGRRGGW